MLQTLVVFGIALARRRRGSRAALPASLVTVVAAVLISVIIASLSNALALLLRQQEALIGISQFIVLPLQFLSSAVMDTGLAGLGADVARYNPVDWAVVAVARGAVRAPGLGRGLAAARPARRPRGAHGVAGDASVRELSALAVTALG